MSSKLSSLAKAKDLKPFKIIIQGRRKLLQSGWARPKTILAKGKQNIGWAHAHPVHPAPTPL